MGTPSPTLPHESDQASSNDNFMDIVINSELVSQQEHLRNVMSEFLQIQPFQFHPVGNALTQGDEQNSMDSTNQPDFSALILRTANQLDMLNKTGSQNNLEQGTSN